MRSAKTAIICLLFLTTTLFGEVGDVNHGGNVYIGGDIYLLDDNWIGLGGAKGRIVFEDESPDKIVIHELFHSILESATTNAAIEVGRFQAECSGTPTYGFGTSISFYAEAENGTIYEIGALQFIPDSPFVNSQGEFSILTYDVQSGELVAQLKSSGDDIGFYSVDDDKYIFLNCIGAGAQDRTLTIDMGESNRAIDWSGGAEFTIEATSRINQDLTTDASPEFATPTVTSLITGGDIGVVGDTDLLQLAANSLAVNGTVTVTQDYAADVSAVAAWEVDGSDDLMPITGNFNDMYFDLDGNDDLMPTLLVHFVPDTSGDLMPTS